MSIPKDRLELFAVKAVKDTLADPLTVQRVEHHLQLLLNNQSEQRQKTLETLERSIEENKIKRKNLIEALELRKAGSNPQTILERLEELEKEGKESENKLTALGAERTVDSHYVDSSHAVASFILNFEEEFEKADPFHKKSLLKRCISDILVNRDKKVVRLAVRRIPAVNSELNYLLQNKKAATEVVTAVSSGGRT